MSYISLGRNGYCPSINGYFPSIGGASSGILVVWDRRVVGKIEECWGVYCCLAFSEMSKMVSLGLLCTFMGPVSIVIEGIYRSWLVCLLGGICHGALGETLTSPAFLVKDRSKRILVPLWSFLILYLSRASWIFPL